MTITKPPPLSAQSLSIVASLNNGRPLPLPEGPLCTTETLTSQFKEIGINKGDTLLLHSSLSSLGWVNGGAEAVVRSLLTILGEEGTLVVPTHTSENSWPDNWSDPFIPPEWRTIVQNTLLPFDPATSRSRNMGVIAETVRAWPGALRSLHPRTSFAAFGADAAFITARHPIECFFGVESPLGALEAVQAKILLLGVPFDTCTAFHLAEYSLPEPKLDWERLRVLRDGRPVWVTVDTIDFDNEDFDALGADMEKANEWVTRKMIGGASSVLFPMPEAVEYARGWMSEHRK